MDPESLCKPDQSSDRSAKQPKKYLKLSAAKRIPVQHGPDSEEEPELSCVSLKSCQSTDRYIDLKEKPKTSERFYDVAHSVQPQHGPDSAEAPELSCVSLKSCQSTDRYIDLKGKRRSSASSFTSPVLNKPKPEPSHAAQTSSRFSDHYSDFNKEPTSAESSSHQTSEVSSGRHQLVLDSVFQEVEEKMAASMRNELKKIQKILSADAEEEEVLLSEGKDQQRKTDAFVNITVDLLREIGQEELADRLQKKTVAAACQRKLRFALKIKFQLLYEGIPKAGKPSQLNQVYTDLYITEGATGEANDRHEVTAYRKPEGPETTIRHEDIFKPLHGREEPIRTVMTQGVAGIGKKVLTRKVVLDWAEGKANQNVQFMFPFTFRELNVLKGQQFSFVELIHHFFNETKEISSFEEFDVVIVLNGLDECRLPLDFHKTKTITDPRKISSMNVLLTNLIRGNLLPSARLWITTRPAAASQIPPECVDMVTEVRGFTHPQKEEYFRKRFRDEEQANRIISHIKTSRSLEIMYHIPVFCWISATVLEDVLKREGGELPKTLTEMYIHFLVVQAKIKMVKYDGGAETDPHWSPENKKMIESLGKLAFDQLQKGNLIFYESDLTECGIDIKAASVYSGVFTQVFKEERGLYQDKVFCFIHLSVQEFLAALYVHLTFINSGVNLLLEEDTALTETKTGDDSEFYQSAIDKALQSPNGHLDLFLRFLLGLSLEANRTLLRDLQTGSRLKTNQATITYIKEKISGSRCTEERVNLFHCLNELNDSSLVEEILFSSFQGGAVWSPVPETRSEEVLLSTQSTETQ